MHTAYQSIRAKNERRELSTCISLNGCFWIISGLRKNGKKLRKNPTISYLFIVVVIKYSLLKMATKKGGVAEPSGPKVAVYHYYWS